jgi:hypothetical protein
MIGILWADSVIGSYNKNHTWKEILSEVAKSVGCCGFLLAKNV